jgi:hypothetical protein
MRVQTSAFPEHGHLYARLGGRNRGTAAGRAGADYEDVGRLGSMHGLMVHPTVFRERPSTAIGSAGMLGRLAK